MEEEEDELADDSKESAEDDDEEKGNEISTGTRNGGENYPLLFQAHTRGATCKEALAPGLEARGRTCRARDEDAYTPWALYREAYAPSHLRGDAPARAQC